MGSPRVSPDTSPRGSSSSSGSSSDAPVKANHLHRKVMLVAVLILGVSGAIIGCYVTPVHEFFVASSKLTTAGVWIVGASSFGGTGSLAYIFWPALKSLRGTSTPPPTRDDTPEGPKPSSPHSRSSSISVEDSNDFVFPKPNPGDSRIRVSVSGAAAASNAIPHLDLSNPAPTHNGAGRPRAAATASNPNGIFDVSHIALPPPTHNNGSGGAPPPKALKAFIVKKDQIKVDGRGACLFLSFAVGERKLTNQPLNEEDAYVQKFMYDMGTHLRAEVVSWMQANVEKDPELQKHMKEGVIAHLEKKHQDTIDERDAVNLESKELNEELDKAKNDSGLSAQQQISVIEPRLTQLQTRLTDINQRLDNLRKDLASIKEHANSDRARVLILRREYIASLAAANTFATGAEVYALSQLKQTQIIVHQVLQGDEPPSAEAHDPNADGYYGSKFQKQGGTILLLFKNGNHYDFWKARK